MNTNDPIIAARNHLAAFPNAFFNFQRNVSAPHSIGKADVLCAEVNGKLHPLAFPGLALDQANTIDQLMTDHNTAVYEQSLANKTNLVDIKVPQTQVKRDEYPNFELNNDNNEDDEDEDDDLYGEHDGEYADHERWQEDLTQHQVPGQLAEQARRTQAINDETIAAKMSEYHQVQEGQYTWNDAMINLTLEAAMIATLVNPNALIGADGRSRIVPGRRGPTDVSIVDTNGVAHSLVFVDHRLGVTDADVLDQNGQDLLDKANALLLGNLKRQVLEIAEALRFIEPEKKNWLATLGDIVKHARPQNDEHTMRANGLRVVARITGKNSYNGNTRIEIEGTVGENPYTATLSISADRYNVSVYDVYGEDEEALTATFEGAEAHYRETATRATNEERENVRERCAEYIPTAQALARRLGDEIRGMERGLAHA